MTTSIQSPRLLERYDSSELVPRLFRRETTAPIETDFGNLLETTAPATDTADTRLRNFAADLNAARSLQYGATYAADGAAQRATANTVLIGYA